MPPPGIRAIPLIVCMLGLLLSCGCFMPSLGALQLGSAAGDPSVRHPVIAAAVIGLLGGDVHGVLCYQVVAHRWEQGIARAPLEP